MKMISDSVPIYNLKKGIIEQIPRVVRTDDEWKAVLTPASYDVTRMQGTEYAFSGAYHDTKVPGSYLCICCGTALFLSEDKFDSGTGWPSFSKPVSDLNVVAQPDHAHGMARTKVRCARCGAHLGHVFDDGPPPSGLRYCMNSLSLKFVP